MSFAIFWRTFKRMESTREDCGEESSEVTFSQPGLGPGEENDAPKHTTPKQGSEEVDDVDMLNLNASEDDDLSPHPKSQSDQADKPPSALEQMKSVEHVSLLA
jgi:hypothetical protein